VVKRELEEANSVAVVPAGTVRIEDVDEGNGLVPFDYGNERLLVNNDDDDAGRSARAAAKKLVRALRKEG
jgi:hypothetical protein